MMPLPETLLQVTVPCHLRVPCYTEEIRLITM